MHFIGMLRVCHFSALRGTPDARSPSLLPSTIGTSDCTLSSANACSPMHCGLKDSRQLVAQRVHIREEKRVLKSSSFEVYTDIIPRDTYRQRIVLIRVDITPERSRDFIVPLMLALRLSHAFALVIAVTIVAPNITNATSTSMLPLQCKSSWHVRIRLQFGRPWSNARSVFYFFRCASLTSLSRKVLTWG